MKRLLHRRGEEAALHAGAPGHAFDFAAFVDDDDDDDDYLDGAADPFQPNNSNHQQPSTVPSSSMQALDEWMEDHPAPFDDPEFGDEDHQLQQQDDDRPSSSLLARADHALREAVHGRARRQRAAKSVNAEDGDFNRDEVDEDEDGDEERLELELDEEIKERSTREETRLKYRQTMVYCGTYLAQGMAGGCIGPTLLLLAANTSSEVDDMGLIFTIRGLGWIVGSLCAGRLYESTGKRSHAVLFVATVAMAVFLFLFPFARVLWLLLALHAVNAFFASFNDVGANTLMFQVWQREVAPYMQFLHFSYGVGSTSAPAIIALVLLVAPSDAQLLWCYWVLGVLVLLPSFFALMVPSPAPIATPKLDEESRNDGGQDVPVWLRHFIIFLTAFSLFTYVGIEIAYGGWIFTYAVNEFHMGETEADYLSSAFWLAITIGRLLAVPLATRFSSRSLLLTDHIGSTLAIIVAIIVVPFKNNFSLWVVTLLYGLFMASIYALVFSFPYQLGVAITSRASSLLVVGSSLGAMLVPMGAGFIFNKIAASLLMWTILVGNLLLLAVYFLVAIFLPRCMGLTVTAHATSSATAIKEGDDEAGLVQMLEDDDVLPHSRRKAHAKGGAFALVPLGNDHHDDLGRE